MCLSIHNIYKAIRPYPVSGIRYPNKNKNNPKTKHNLKANPPVSPVIPTKNHQSKNQPSQPKTNHTTHTTPPSQSQNQIQPQNHPTHPYQQPATKIPLPNPIHYQHQKSSPNQLPLPPPTTPSQKPHYPQYCKVDRENPKNSHRCGVGDFAQKPTLNQYLQAKKRGLRRIPFKNLSLQISFYRVSIAFKSGVIAAFACSCLHSASLRA